MADLFVYGTLMDDARVAGLTGRRFRKEVATLPGYRKIVAGVRYPYIVPDADARVDGPARAFTYVGIPDAFTKSVPEG